MGNLLKQGFLPLYFTFTVSIKPKACKLYYLSFTERYRIWIQMKTPSTFFGEVLMLGYLSDCFKTIQMIISIWHSGVITFTNCIIKQNVLSVLIIYMYPPPPFIIMAILELEGVVSWLKHLVFGFIYRGQLIRACGMWI